jgi:hypothetical protein
MPTEGLQQIGALLYLISIMGKASQIMLEKEILKAIYRGKGITYLHLINS